VGDAENMDFQDNTFDSIVCLEVIQHTTSPTKLLSEIYRTLKPGGSLLLAAPFNFEINTKCDYFRFTMQGLEWLLQDFSSVV
jgi:ubiquinone/menaquinone biosynthesis C-methylase UbiE